MKNPDEPTIGHIKRDEDDHHAVSVIISLDDSFSLKQVSRIKFYRNLKFNIIQISIKIYIVKIKTFLLRLYKYKILIYFITKSFLKYSSIFFFQSKINFFDFFQIIN